MSASSGVRDVFSKPLLAMTAAFLGVAASALAEAPAAVEEKVALGPPPTDFGLKYDYYTDALLVSVDDCTR